MKIIVIMMLIILPVKNKEINEVITGKASWYGKEFHGGTTANGSTFDMYKASAASNQIPLNTKLLVWKDGGDTVELKVTDRMATHTGKVRVLDLSKKAMKLIAGDEGIKRGVIDVNIQVL